MPLKLSSAVFLLEIANGIVTALLMCWWILFFLRPRFWTPKFRLATIVYLAVASLAVLLCWHFLPEIIH
jgi:hypothetical protein